jgi:hypothetical protein
LFGQILGMKPFLNPTLFSGSLEPRKLIWWSFAVII